MGATVEVEDSGMTANHLIIVGMEVGRRWVLMNLCVILCRIGTVGTWA